MTLQLVPLCTVDVTLAEPIVVGNGPRGLRFIAEFEAMAMAGDRLRGSMKGKAAADWVTVVGPAASVDVRATVETTDGAIIYCQYTGRFDLTNGRGAAPIYVAPTFETADERYQWLNLVQAAGVGTLNGSELHYEWFELRAT
jgi:hypothetical protein